MRPVGRHWPARRFDLVHQMFLAKENGNAWGGTRGKDVFWSRSQECDCLHTDTESDRDPALLRILLKSWSDLTGVYADIADRHR